MEDHVYRSPEAPLLLPERAPDRYYVVSPTKYWVLSVATVGMYRLYWHYRNWTLYRASTGERMWPVMRAIFSIFFTHSLFREVDASIRSKALAHAWHPMGIATLYVIVTLAENLSQRLPNSAVFSDAGAISSLADVRVEVQLTRFERAPDGVVTLAAEVAVHGTGGAARPPIIQRFTLSEKPSASSTAGVVASLSRLLGKLADGIAPLILQQAM